MSQKLTITAVQQSKALERLRYAMKYEQIVYFKFEQGISYIAVDYLFADGRRVFQTHYELPEVADEEEGFNMMAKAAEWLGNSLLISAPEFRKHIGIEGEE